MRPSTPSFFFGMRRCIEASPDRRQGFVVRDASSAQEQAALDEIARRQAGQHEITPEHECLGR
jgi:hypothetical protein